jgi:hypothetical protein
MYADNRFFTSAGVGVLFQRMMADQNKQVAPIIPDTMPQPAGAGAGVGGGLGGSTGTLTAGAGVAPPSS